MYSGKSLAHTGIALGSLTVVGIAVPWLAIGAAAAVIVGALALRLRHKLSQQ